MYVTTFIDLTIPLGSLLSLDLQFRQLLPPLMSYCHELLWLAEAIVMRLLCDYGAADLREDK